VVTGLGEWEWALRGGGNEKDRTKNENDTHGNGNGGKTGMAEQEWWQNTGIVDYSCSLNK
jgi:hypothetical protein